MAKQTPGFSGADIANVCNEAALIAARKNKTVVEKQDFLDAVDRIVGGLERKTKDHNHQLRKRQLHIMKPDMQQSAGCLNMQARCLK